MLKQAGTGLSIGRMAAPIMLSALLQVFLPVPVLAADLIADNLTVQDGKADGEIGEQADGMLGVVRGNPDSGVMGSVAELNTVRRDTYRQAAAKAGTTFQQEAEKAGEINIRETPAGQYYRAADGVWTKKK